MRVRSAALTLILLVFGAAVSGAGMIRLQLRVKPALDLKGTERVFVGPILLEPGAGEAERSVDLSAVRELEAYIRKTIRRQTRLTLLPPAGDLTLPASTLGELLGERELWLEIGRRTGADYIVAASLDVEVLDREGYHTEEYVSPADGKTYFRQVLVEETGFDYDILLVVIDASSGEKVHQELIHDFKERPKRQLSVYKEMFNDLYHLSNRLLGVFVPRSVQARRYLYGG